MSSIDLPDPLYLSRALLHMQVITLYEQGYRDTSLRAETEQFNQSLDPPVDQQFLDETLKAYEDEEEHVPLSPLEQAITSKDLQGIFATGALQELVALKTRADGSFSLIIERIKQAFGKSLKMSELTTATRRVEQQQREQDPDIADVAYDWSTRYRNLWAYSEERGRWYVWNDTYWAEQDAQCSALDEYAIVALHEAGLQVNSTTALNLFRRSAMTYCVRQFNQCHSCINFTNGTLHWDTMELVAHAKDDNFTYCLPYRYDLHGDHTQTDAFLEVTIPDLHGRQAYMAHLGLALLRDTSLHRFLLLLGPTRAGKTLLLALANLMCEMVDVGQAWEFAGASLFSRELEGKRSRFQWGNRRIVAIDELPSEALQEEELVKAMSAHSGVEMRGINRDEKEHNRWMPKLIMNANDTPSYKDISGAVRQRAIIVKCPNGPLSEEDQNPHLFEQLLAPEIGAFAATCIHYGLLALQRGSYPRSAEMKKHLHEIGVEGNPLKGFLEEKMLLDPEARVLSGGVYEQYRSYCSNHGYKLPLAAHSMSRALCDMHIGITKDRMRYDGKVERCLVGVRLRKDEDPEQGENQFQDDTLLVDAVDATVTLFQNSVNTLDEPEKLVQGTVLTLLTPFGSMSPQKEQKESERKNIFSPSRTSISKIASTASTNFIKGPVEPPEGVDAILEKRHGSVNSVNSPPGQQHGTNGHQKEDEGEEQVEFRL